MMQVSSSLLPSLAADYHHVLLRPALARRAVSKGKRKELSPRGAALLIQMCFGENLVRRSQVLRGLRDLVVYKTKLTREMPCFSNLSYRRRVANDVVERQRFSEKVIVLLLTVDAVGGPGYMVRAARKSMVDDLEAVLEIVDRQTPRKLGSTMILKFDLPDGGACREMALGVAEVVHMLNEKGNNSSA